MDKKQRPREVKMEELVEMIARFFKYTPKKLRFNGEADGISVSVYVEKTRHIPAEVRITLIKEDRKEG